jgi:hypothetical protein
MTLNDWKHLCHSQSAWQNDLKTSPVGGTAVASQDNAWTGYKMEDDTCWDRCSRMLLLFDK